ncbi:MAG: alpha-galactosidase, partial [Treponema sp.]|nr:alpha-galactosidase [Treponema sp.]
MKIEKVLDGASVKYENGLLLISTGIMSRIWEWQGNGFATRETSHSGYDIKCTGSGSCDFNIFGLSANADAQLRGIDVQIIDDGLTSKHLEAAAIISYPVLFICVKYVIWVYPGAHGLRTQLYIKTFGDYKPATDYGESITETLVFPAVSGIKAAGYYNDTQHRNKADTEIIREESFVDPGSMVLDWANLVALFNSKGGMCVVKESNKCVNQNSYDTGAFIYENGLLKVSGAGLKPEDLREDRYLLAWASWTIFFDGTEDGLETAVKEFDRQRFPVNNSNDIYIMSNTWGTTNSILPRDTACAESVLKDIPVAAEIGVDVLQIDAGWNSPMGSEKKDNPDTAPWYTHKSKYPDGWDMVTKSAAEKGLVLGLWFPWMASADEIIDNMRLGNFRYFKIDYANLNSREYLDSLIDKAHKVYAAGGGKVRINWDV